MFDDVIRELRGLERGVQVSITLPDDEEGYFDRRCPNPECRAEFKVLSEDWKEKVRDEIVYCSICRFEADSTEWNTLKQQSYIERAAESYLHDRLNRAFTRSARRFNQQQPRSGFIKLCMSYRPGPRPILLPLSASAIMRQKSSCEDCGCRYSSIGASLFCPACGHNSAASTFDSAINTVRQTIESLPMIRQALAEEADDDIAENSVRQICENGLVKLISAFQRLAEAQFESLPNPSQIKRRRNVFQNLTESSELWRTAIGRGYTDMLLASELKDLERFFQQRHLLVHREGIVDQEYIDKSSDHRYVIGQRLVVREEAVLLLATLVSKLANELRKSTR